MSLSTKNLNWLSLSAFILALDQLSKYFVTHFLVNGEVFAVFSFFNLSLSHNRGAAFSFLAEAGGWQLLFFSSISILAVILLTFWLLKLKTNARLEAFAIALIIGGAVGNLVDRLQLGYVVDFLDFYYQQWHYATFNVADSVICMGAALLILNGFRSKS